MKLPISWLKEYVDLEDISIKQLEEKLISSGFEVDEVKFVGEEISNCVTGQITSIEKHADSDHLQICKLNCGQYGEDIQIVTGAQNVFVGAIVPAALHGATLAGGVKIKNGKLRGVVSNGMLCSGEELGITEDFYPDAGVDGILILPENTQIGLDIKDVVGLNDYVFDVSITANRPDCQSIIGLAREVCAIFDRKLKNPSVFFVPNEESDKSLEVEVKNQDVCTRYMATVCENVKIEKSPYIMAQRLIKCGINPINNIVDITNYILLELGQPMHAFDLSKLEGNKIIVRDAASGEKIKTLDEKEFDLSPNNLVIADAKRPVALAGVMGGLESGVSENTTAIVFESAVFKRESVRKTSRGLGQASDSSHRYEKGIDTYTTEVAMKRALNLLEGLKAGKSTNIAFDIQAEERETQIISTTYEAINNLLGIVVPNETIADILTRLNFNVISDKDSKDLVVEVPPYRTDLDGMADLAEEVIRIYGYDHIVPRLLPTTLITDGGLNQEQKQKARIKNFLTAQGFSEMITYSFFGEKDLDLFRFPRDAEERKFIRIQNPLTEDVEIMKTILAPSTVGILAKDIKKGIAEARVFELANVYLPKELPIEDFPHERMTLSLGAYGKGEDFYTLKGSIEALAALVGKELKFEKADKPYLHPTRSANIIMDGEVVGVMGQVRYEITEALTLNNEIFVAEIDFEKFMSLANFEYSFKNISKHPSIRRDLALVVREEITTGEVEEIIKQTGKKVSKIELFDIYQGEQVQPNHKSFAYHITFAADENPLTHEEVDASIKKILYRLNEKLGVVIRN